MASDREITLGDIGRTIWRGKWYVVLSVEAAFAGGTLALWLVRGRPLPPLVHDTSEIPSKTAASNWARGLMEMLAVASDHRDT